MDELVQWYTDVREQIEEGRALLRSLQPGDGAHAVDGAPFVQAQLARRLLEMSDCIREAHENLVHLPDIDAVGKLDEALRLIGELLPQAPHGSGQHRALTTIGAVCAAARARRLGRREQEAAAVRQVEQILREDGDPASQDSWTPDDDAWWSLDLVDDAHLTVADFLMRADEDSDEERDRLVVHLDAMVNTTLFDARTIAARRVLLGVTLADRSRGEDYQSPEKSAARDRAIAELRTALECPDLEPDRRAEARLQLGDRMFARLPDDEADVTAADLLDILDLVEPVCRHGDDRQRNLAHPLAQTTAALLCTIDPDPAHRLRLVALSRHMLADSALDASDLGGICIELIGQLVERADGEWAPPPSGHAYPDPACPDPACPDPAQDLAEARRLCLWLLGEEGYAAFPEQLAAVDGEERTVLLNYIVELLSRIPNATIPPDELDRLIMYGVELVDRLSRTEDFRGEVYLKVGVALFRRAWRGFIPHVVAIQQSALADGISFPTPDNSLALRLPGSLRDLDTSLDMLGKATELYAPEEVLYGAAAVGRATGLALRHVVLLPEGDPAALRACLRWYRITTEAPIGDGLFLADDLRDLLVFAILLSIWSTEPFEVHRRGFGAQSGLPDLSGLGSIREEMQLLERIVESRMVPGTDSEATALFIMVIVAVFHDEPDYRRMVRHIDRLEVLLPHLDAEDVVFREIGLLFVRRLRPAVETLLAGQRPPHADRTAPQADDDVYDADLDLSAAVLVGDGSAYPFTVPVGRVVEVLEDVEAHRPAEAAYPALDAAFALARHDRWLRQRDGLDLAEAIRLARRAASARGNDPRFTDRAAQLMATLLLDRYTLLGDRADLLAADLMFRDLLARTQHGPDPGDLPGLPALLAGICAARGPADVRDLLPEAEPPATPLRAELLAASGNCALLLATPQSAALAERQLTEAAGLLPADHPRRPAVLAALAELAGDRAAADRDGAALHRAVADLLDAASRCPRTHPHRSALVLRAAAALARLHDERRDPRAGREEDCAHCAQRGEPLTLGRGIDLLRESAADPGRRVLGARIRCLYGLGRLLFISFLRGGDRTDLDQAVTSLVEAWGGMHSSPGDPLTPVLLRALAQAYRAYGPGDPANRRKAREVARSVLTAHREAVMLQAGTKHGFEAARLSEADMLRLVRWCTGDRQWAAAVEALELGRGLVLHAATAAAGVPALLREAGRDDLAQRWSRSRLAAEEDSGLLTVPDDLRRVVLETLEGSFAERALLSPPTVREVAAALRRVGADVLVHLVPGTEWTSGHALIVAEADDGARIEHIALPMLHGAPGRELDRYARALEALHEAARTKPPRPDPAAPAAGKERYAAAVRAQEEADAAWERALGALCEWAGDAALRDVLRRVGERIPGRAPRLVLAPAGALGLVPWHAARVSAPGAPVRRACQEAVISSCSTAGQLVETSARRTPAPGGAQVMVVDPQGSATMHHEARAIRAAFYPQSLVVGDLHWWEDEEMGDGPWTGPAPVPATARRLLPLLPGRGDASAALLIANCHGSVGATPVDSRLLLDPAGGHAVTVEELLAGAHGREAGSPGGLVVLVDCSSDLTLDHYDESLTLATAFLSAGAAGVVGARWLVDDEGRTTVFMYMFHHFLNGRSAPAVPEAAGSPADALRAAQNWMLDPGRELPAALRDDAFASDRADRPFSALRIWAGFAHHGR
jgi:CHAT domain